MSKRAISAQEAGLLTAGGKKLASRGRSASARLLHEGSNRGLVLGGILLNKPVD